MTSKARQLADLGGDTANLEDVSSAYGSGALSSRNKIINGGMVIDQRNNGSAVTVNNTSLNYCVDRWWGTGRSADGVYTLQRSTTTPPSGFTHFLRATVTTADASIASGDTYYIGTKIEGFNVSDLGFGSANAKTITISFAVRSSVTGTFSGALLNGAENRSYPFTFAVSSANTWETKSVTIAGDTTGTWATGNSAGMVLCFDLGNGSNFRATAGSWDGSGKYGVTGAVTLISTLNATFDITGVQLEVGDTATPFEHRSFGQELALCQRYFERIGGNASYSPIGIGSQRTTEQTYFNVYFKQIKRAAPTVSFSGNVVVTERKTYDQVVTSITDSLPSVFGFHGRFTHSAVGAAYRPHHVTSDANGSGYMDFDAEL